MPAEVVQLNYGETCGLTAHAGNLLREAHGASASVTSEMAAGVLGLVAALASEGHAIGINAIGHALALPLLGAAEGLGVDEPQGKDPFQWPAYTGRARVTMAWQLVESFRKIRSVKPLVTIGVLDGGFWLNGRTPGFAGGQGGSDFGASVMQLNLLDESVGAGGANPNPCNDGYNCPWHGNAVASVAAAPVGNGLGTAGVGGSIARPVFFKSEMAISQIFRCLQVCLAWGVDVLNMSFGTTYWELVFPTSAWNDSFQFAADNHLILVAAAGNNNQNLPDDRVLRPATRTPGTITVGALDFSDGAAGFSNYGASVDVWAPGVNLSVAPDPNNLLGSLESGTSVAAPFVSGIVAMMRAVKPSLNTFEANQILKNTGWKGQGRVTKGVDAFAAVLAAMGGTLPDDFAEHNDTRQTASTLYPLGTGGSLVPLGGLSDRGVAVLSHGADVDWYRFKVTEYSAFALDMRWYPLLGHLRVELLPDDADSRASVDVVQTFATGSTRLAGPLAPGEYKLRVFGHMNLYEIGVSLTSAPIGPDEFEANDSLDTPTRFHLYPPGAPKLKFPDFKERSVNGPGRYELTIHGSNPDYFRFQVEPIGPIPAAARVRLFQTDVVLDVAVFDAERNLVQRLSGRALSVDLPPGMVTLVEVSAPKPTRYSMAVHYAVDPSHLPPWVHDQYVVPLPDLGDPQPLEHANDRPGDLRTHYFVDLTRDRQALNRLVFASPGGGAFRAELLDHTGIVVAAGRLDQRSMHPTLTLDTTRLPAAGYVLRLQAGQADTASSVPSSGAMLQIERLPAFLGAAR